MGAGASAIAATIAATIVGMEDWAGKASIRHGLAMPIASSSTKAIISATTVPTDIWPWTKRSSATAAGAATVDVIQQIVTEELKDALRRQTVDRDLAKAAIRFLGQPMGRSLHVKLRKAYRGWQESRDDGGLLAAISLLAEEFGKAEPVLESTGAMRREDLELICFESVTG